MCLVRIKNTIFVMEGVLVHALLSTMSVFARQKFDELQYSKEECVFTSRPHHHKDMEIYKYKNTTKWFLRIAYLQPASLFVNQRSFLRRPYKRENRGQYVDFGIAPR